MTLSPADTVAIHEGAASLAERFSGSFAPKDEQRGQGERLLSLWKQTAGTSDLQRLATALGSRCTIDEALPTLLGPVRSLSGNELPAWAAIVPEIVEAVATAFTNSEVPISGRSSRGSQVTKIPFWQLYLPIAQLARLRVADRLAGSGNFLAERAWEDLQCLLMCRISAVASTALHTKFLAHRAFALSGMAHLFADHDRSHSSPASATEDQPHYVSFIREEGCDGLRLFFLRYPVAARLVAEATLSWIEVTNEFLMRCHNDRNELAKRFNHNVLLAKIARVGGGLSDPHNDGRTVLAVTFANGLRLMYKPHSLRIDVLYFSLLEELNTHAPAVPLQTLTVLDCGSYGWVEFVRSAPCSSKAAAKRFYHRAGGLVALCHWLQAIDCHRENLVAAGEQPMLIDLEALAHPLSPEEVTFAQEHGSTSLALSPVRSGLLPVWQAPFGKKLFYDNSALGGPVFKRSLFPTVCWRNLDTDQIAWKYVLEVRSHHAHRPRLLHRLLAPGQFPMDIQRGYRAMVQLLSGAGEQTFARYREEICATTRRWIKRPTPIYSLLLRQSLQPERLTDGAARSIGLQALSCKLGDEAEWAAEIASLERLDVPYFTMPDGSDRGLDLPKPCFDQSPDSDQSKQIRYAIQSRLMLQNGRLIKNKPSSRNAPVNPSRLDPCTW